MKECATKLSELVPLMESVNDAHYCRLKTFAIALSLLDRIETLHNVGYVHGDITIDSIRLVSYDPLKLQLTGLGGATPIQ